MSSTREVDRLPQLQDCDRHQRVHLHNREHPADYHPTLGRLRPDQRRLDHDDHWGQL